MKNREIVSIGISLFVSTIINGTVYYYLFLDTFDLFGIDTIRNPENLHRKIFYTTLLLTLFNTASFVVLKAKMNKVAYGTLISIIISFFLFVRIAPTYLDKSNYYEQFSIEKWKGSEKARLKIARLLIKEKILIGLRKSEVIDKLGVGVDGNLSGPVYLYDLSGHDCKLVLRFEGEKVTSTDLWVDD